VVPFTATGIVQPLFLPSPAKVLSRLAELYGTGQLMATWNLDLSHQPGFLISTALACPSASSSAAIVAGKRRSSHLRFHRYMPVVAFGAADHPVDRARATPRNFSSIFIGTFFQQVLLVMDNVNPSAATHNLGRTLKCRNGRILQRIVLPSACRRSGIRCGSAGLGRTCSSSRTRRPHIGSGYRITTAQRFFSDRSDLRFLLILGVLGLTPIRR